jgi:hypothetical protein
MASQGAIAAAVIGAVGAVAAAVLAVVLPQVLHDNGPGGGTTGPTFEMPQQTEVHLFTNKESAPVGATVQVSGTGFGANESVEIYFGAELVATTRAANGGDFANVSIKVPDFFKHFSKPMSVDVRATGKPSIRSARAAFTIS